MKKFVCSVCGYVHEGDAAPEKCPVCKVPAEKFNEVKEDKHIIVEFSLIEHVITTEVKGEGGTISGEGSTKENPYEIVLYGNDSVNDIKVIPEYGYKIKNITISQYDTVTSDKYYSHSASIKGETSKLGQNFVGFFYK